MKKTAEDKSKQTYLNLRSYDQFGEEFKLKFGGSEQLKTSMGGCLSFLGILFLLFSLYVIAVNYVSTESPEISSYNQYTPEYPKMDLYDEKIFIAIFFLDIKSNGVLPFDKIEKYFTLRGQVNTIDFSVENPENLERKDVLSYKFIPCKDIKNPQILSPLETHLGTKQLLLSSALCPDISESDFDKYFIQGKPAAPPMTSSYFSIYPCSLPNKDDCAPEEDVNLIQIAIAETEKSLDMSNFQDPITPIVKIDRRFYVRVKSYTHLKFWYKLNEIWDETFDLTDAKKRFSFVDFDYIERDLVDRTRVEVYCTYEDILNSNCDDYLLVENYVTGKKVIYKRTYNKLLQSLADLGGFKEVVFVLLGVIYSIFLILRPNKMLRYVKKRLFNLSENEEEEVQSYLKLDNKKLDAVVEKNLDVDFDGIELFGRLNEMKILSEIFFEDYHEKLLPLAILNITNKIMKSKEKRSKVEQSKKTSQNMSYYEAYRRLLESKPENKIKEEIKKFLVENLPKISIHSINTSMHHLKDKRSKILMK